LTYSLKYEKLTHVNKAYLIFLICIKLEVKMTIWTTSDINNLSSYYMKGYPIKEISKLLKRSPTALHKAISRFKLHPLRTNPIKLNSLNEDDNDSSYKERSKKFHIKKFFEKCMNEEWVSFKDVLIYLKQNGVIVVELDQKNEEGQKLFALNRKIFVDSQVLLVANRMRIEEKKAPFKVERICA
jgi:hypothetical protein